MSMAYPSLVQSRSRLRKVSDTLEGYVRIDLVEERMFPTATVLRYVAVVFPVMLYYFQSAFLDLPDRDQVFLMMIIGTAVAAGLQDALTGLTNRLNFALERGTLETYLVEPVPWALIPVAMNIWRSFTGGILACIMVALGCLLGGPIEANAIPAALVVLFLGIVACNALGTFAASFIVLFKRGDPIVTLYGLAAGVLGGALFPIEVLPTWIRWVSYLVPHSYVISAERELLMQDPPPGGLSPLWSAVILTVFCLVTFTAGLYVFDRALRLARRLGILSI
ncbi:ABC transporter permease [Micromonospora globbae]|jgi:ABC-2 type transport system permease protein|uniref:ABC transporter permease n=1 Tax=Micromonospora globbae TaxID=1894969 RepID=A0A420EUU4_9ACTN|nr:ABC transporter permease [Micromonospora globbae]RKF24420.1 ABC transporter permease [Micromonospora globbae]